MFAPSIVQSLPSKPASSDWPIRVLVLAVVAAITSRSVARAVALAVVGLVVEMREHSGGKRAGQWESSKVSCLLRQMSPEFRFSFFAPSLDLQRLCVE